MIGFLTLNSQRIEELRNIVTDRKSISSACERTHFKEKMTRLKAHAKLSDITLFARLKEHANLPDISRFEKRFFLSITGAQMFISEHGEQTVEN